MNKKRYVFLLPLLFFTSISIASEEPDDGTNTKTPNDASKIIPGSEKTESHLSNRIDSHCRIGRKRRRQSVLSKHKQMVNQQKRALETK